MLDTFRDFTKSQAGLVFGPDPATHSHCTLGGMLGNNSCGAHSLLSKNHGLGLRTSDNTHELEILTYRGDRFSVGPTPPDELARIIVAGGAKRRIYEQLKQLVDEFGDDVRRDFPKLERRVSGYNLDDLLPENGFHVARALGGSEATLVTILEATMHLVPATKANSVLMLGYPDAFEAAKHLHVILEHKPVACEGIDQKLFDWVKKKGDQNASVGLFPKGNGYLLLQFDGEDKDASDEKVRRMMEALRKEKEAPDMLFYDDPKQEEMIWKVREGGLGSTAWVPGLPDTWPGWEDSAVPVARVAEYLPKLRDVFNKYGYDPSLYGHYGQGCIHCRASFDLYTNHGIEHYLKFLDEATSLVVKMGGSFSGEHGDGQARGALLPKMFTPRLIEAMTRLKRIFDPDGKMNPGKAVVEPYPVDANLRVGPDYNPPQPTTHFSFKEDHGSFGRAALRCVGVGKCRREGGGTMCPSYMVTREEKHSTRGRSRLLFEMMNGEILGDGWKSEAVYDALDLCLSCKGCKGDCPVNVDMATYKSEFLSHYFEGRLRPRHMFAFGFVHWWARLANLAPTLVNLATQTPGLSRIAKLMAGVAPQRRIPTFSPQSLQQWFRDREPRNPNGPPVVLFPDTFNNYLHADVAKDAVATLEDAGFRVIVPQADLCCGRPLYDYGFLNVAKRWWHENLRALRPYLRDSVPMVVLEPSCWAAFRDELVAMLPNDEDAKRLRDLTHTLGEFLSQHAPGYQPPTLPVKAIVHGHCHQKSIEEIGDQEFGKLHGERDILKRMGVDFDMPETGCCGMAGAFGFEAGKHYEVSQQVGERVLLPAVRGASEDTLIVADGFSCKTQIMEDTDRQAMHLAQVIQLAKRSPGGRVATRRPEDAYVNHRRAEQRAAMTRTGLIAATVAGLALVGVALWTRPSADADDVGR